MYRPLIESAASSNDNAYAYRRNSGELHSREAKIGTNIPQCFATRSKLRLSCKRRDLAQTLPIFLKKNFI